jgi:hypothetical protein
MSTVKKGKMRFKKKVKELPHNYDEILLTHEVKFQKNEKVDIQLIRNLVYLYSVKF